jgi:cytochrome c oxidase cbb3-type subunit 3
LAVCSAAALLAACQGAEPSSPQSAESPEQLKAESESFNGRSVADLQADASAMQLAGKLYVANCASCHGADGRGGRGVTDLAGGHYNYGTSEEAIRISIAQGRQSVMPAMAGQDTLGEVDLGQLVAYVRALPSKKGEPTTPYEQRGKMLFAQHCVVCHGADGSGSPEKGAPNLTDDYWQNGESMMNVRLVITAGQKSATPEFASKLSPTEIDLLTGYVLQLVHGSGGSAP